MTSKDLPIDTTSSSEIDEQDLLNELQEFCQEYAIVLEGNGQDYMNKWFNRNADRITSLIEQKAAQEANKARLDEVHQIRENLLNDLKPTVEWYREPFECVDDLLDDRIAQLKAQKGKV